jgi:hypothetical protein
MKTLLLTGAAWVLLFFSVDAQVVYEPFNYPIGSILPGQGGWYGVGSFSPGMATSSLSVPAGMPTPAGNSVSWEGGNVTRLNLNSVTTGDIYYSYAFRVDSIGQVTVTGDSVSALGLGPTDSLYGATVRLKPLSLTSYVLGISKGAPTTTVYDSTVHNVGEVDFIVARYRFNPGTTDDTCDLWVNPDVSSLGSSNAPPPTLQGAGLNRTDLPYVGTFVLQSAGFYYGTLDELRIGSSWQDVTPIPEPGTFAFSLACTAVFLFRTKRNVARADQACRISH